MIFLFGLMGLINVKFMKFRKFLFWFECYLFNNVFKNRVKISLKKLVIYFYYMK